MKPYTYFCPNHDFFDASVGISRSYGRIGTYYLDPGQLLFNYKWPCLHGKGDFNAIFQHTDCCTLQDFDTFEKKIPKNYFFKSSVKILMKSGIFEIKS